MSVCDEGEFAAAEFVVDGLAGFGVELVGAPFDLVAEDGEDVVGEVAEVVAFHAASPFSSSLSGLSG